LSNRQGGSARIVLNLRPRAKRARFAAACTPVGLNGIGVVLVRSNSGSGNALDGSDGGGAVIDISRPPNAEHHDRTAAASASFEARQELAHMRGRWSVA
jgi:hypothetical protein